MLVEGCGGDDGTHIRSKEVPGPQPPPGHEATQVTGTPCPRAMASPAPWLRWTQTELTRWEGEEEEEEEEDEDFERRMDEDGVIGLGEDAGSPPWGDGEDLEEGSLAEEGHWHPRRDLEEEEEQGSSGGDEGPWGAESDGEPYPELSYEGQWGSGSSGSPEVQRDGRGVCQPRSCSTDGGDTSGLSDTSPGPATPSRWHRGWGTAGDTGGGHGQGWTPSRSLQLRLSTDDPRHATSIEPVPKPQPAGTGLPAPGTAALAPTGEPWGAGTPPAPRLHDRSRVPKKAVPTALPPKPGWHWWSLSPQQRHARGKETRDPSGSGTSAADGTQYGRGRLNHPLPDLSKVEARVKFDQSYRPPRGRALPARPSAPGGPIGFKSPAEIVREVLLSSGEGVSPQPPAAAGVPQEFSSPRQATELVQQLQDDYHKLLTKYAEAENTIDQLRLGARVSLYADPPRPSRNLAVGTVGTGCQVMALSIPQPRTATVSSAPAPPSLPGGAPAPGPSDRGGSPQPPSTPPPRGGCPTCPGPCRCSGTQLTQTLAGQTHKLQAQVETFEGWMRAGTPAPREQLQRFRKLKDAQDALERAYLRARQQHPGASGDFDPDRAVEGEIFRLGLCLEELKERLEPGAGRQLPPQHPAQPRCPPAPSPPLAAGSPRPESPALAEGPRGTAGDSEGVTGRLPRPLWHKQLRVEEDFGDLLAQYKHFKSLPESLSLEQLSLAESGSQEEVDGPAAEDGGPSKVPCRTQSLEEGADLETSRLHPPERRAALLPPGEPPLPGDTRGHLSLATAEELPAAAKPPLGLPEPPRAPLSCRSSGVGSTAAQHRPRKEQRIVSPETDSGFVGSEASRVSPPVHTPEHRLPSTGIPGSLGPSIPVPSTLRLSWKKEAAPLPSEPALMGIYPTGGQGGTGGPRLPPSTPSQSSSPPRWAESVGSEAGPNGDGARPSGRCGMRCGGCGGGWRRACTAPAAIPREKPPPVPPRPGGSRWPADHRGTQHPRGSRAPRCGAGRPPGSHPRGGGGRHRCGGTGRSWTSIWGSDPPDPTPLPSRLPQPPSRIPCPPGPRPPPPRRRALGAPRVRCRFGGSTRAVTPRSAAAPREEAGTPGCPRCRGSRTASAGSWVGDAARQPRHSTPRRTRCPTCQAPMGPPAPNSRDGATRAERGPGGTSPPDPHVGPRAEKPEQPGLWYLAASPAATAAIGCLAPVPLVPYAPSVLYCSPAVPTSAPALAGVPLQHAAGHWRAEHPPRPHAAGHHRCLTLDLEGLEELNRSLSRAVEAAQSMRLTTTRMSRALTAELSRARDLRGSCLF
ncbi:microtubule organization protein AKNA isoform X8 [Grus americana]|uniref:microtubule organization protein AKNA isoform X8 n=1 Tax=Grus americana TaxID=9117 RepID=UPI002407F4B2|nr:microtubule organization protein AKNA isoform X8 [Grus americana]